MVPIADASWVSGAKMVSTRVWSSRSHARYAKPSLDQGWSPDCSKSRFAPGKSLLRILHQPALISSGGSVVLVILIVGISVSNGG